jgi:hypothetical protein
MHDRQNPDGLEDYEGENIWEIQKGTLQIRSLPLLEHSKSISYGVGPTDVHHVVLGHDDDYSVADAVWPLSAAQMPAREPKQATMRSKFLSS